MTALKPFERKAKFLFYLNNPKKGKWCWLVWDILWDMQN